MSKCWYCNEELLLGNNTEHIGICDKCYDEMFQFSNEFVKGLMDKIADLEAKLAENEEKYNATNRAYWELVEKQDNDFLQYEKLIGENQKLKQQLFESGLKTLEEIKLSEQRKKMLEDLSTKNWELEQQLAEKEDFIEDLMTGRVKPVIPRIKEIEKQYQDKISFAVEKLKETKIYVDNQHFMKARYKCEKKVYADIWNYIDNQIKELKKEMK